MKGEPGPARLACIFTIKFGLVGGLIAYFVFASGYEGPEGNAREDAWRAMAPEIRDQVRSLKMDRRAFEKRLEDLLTDVGPSEETRAMREALKFDDQQRADSREVEVAILIVGSVVLSIVWVVAYCAMKARMG